MGIAAAVAAVVGTGAAIYNGQQQKKSAAAANAQAKSAADAQAKQADEANNRANQKSPDTSAILSAQQQAGKTGASSTMLTGASGVDPNSLNLGKTTLLGQ